MIYIAGLGWNGIVGYSAITLDAPGRRLRHRHGAIRRAAFYGNAATPRGALKVAKKMTPEGMKYLRESVAAVHADTANAHRLMVFEEGVEFQPFSISPDDAQYLDARKFQVLEMCRIFRVPPHKIMDYSNAGSAYRALEEK